MTTTQSEPPEHDPAADSLVVPDEEAWRALARSSPWLWRTVHVDFHYEGIAGSRVSAWLRQPDGIRVEAAHEIALGSTIYLGPHRRDAPAPGELPATYREDGLVSTRADHLAGDDHGLYFNNYYWLAVLDPRELADGTHDTDKDALPAPGTEVGELAATLRRGRLTWWAQVRPTTAYEPRCGCCALLPAIEVLEREYGDQAAERATDAYPYPTTWLAGLDRQTGLCVSLAALDGSEPGRGHSLTIHEVDADYPDSLFTRR